MKVLIIRLSSMGDVIHTLPAVTDAAKNISNIEFHWVIEKDFSSIPSWHNSVSRVIPVELRQFKNNLFSGRKYFRDLITHLRKEKYDLIIDSQGLIKSMILAVCCHGKVAGYSKHSAREPIASIGYKYKYNISHNQHAISKNRELFSKCLGYSINNHRNSIDYGINPAINTEIEQKDYLIFLHGTTWASKCWPFEKWLALAKIADKDGIEVQVTYATQQQKNRAIKLASLASNVKIKDHMGLNDAATWISNAKAIISVDTGFGHLAAAFNKPVVGLFGPTKTALTGILGNDKCVYLFSTIRHCAPCLQKKCPLLTSKNIGSLCMNDHSPVEVWDALCKKLNAFNNHHVIIAS
ncbi:MAG: lipopolysaccharide heptosyltransferase I [Francisellaceae bacterium]|jgi:heptosyltransferase I|nr:lipopolysaccharide heptosyltransferase I [Francisellaceae bacterium]MBT6208336.1 lipopolysaccharide heptosyltransferase I [Francisellaceae bacterium]MBT6539378.1 lipopolysaccharide heptosyltransferase I [Francisellaceae bacterium]